MSNLPTQVLPSEVIEKVLITGDLTKLTTEQRLHYYLSLCGSLGLNPNTKPFEYITLNGKLTLYARKDCTDQLRRIYHISIQITDRSKIDDVYIVTAKAKNHGGREDESTGAVNVAGLRGDALANALMKAETKAKRRATLSICGLGMLDEAEIETIKDARPVSEPKAQTVVEAVNRPLEPVVQPDNGEYVIPIGRKYRGMNIKDVPPDHLKEYCKWLRGEHEKKGNAPYGDVLEFLERADLIVSEFEVSKFNENMKEHAHDFQWATEKDR